MTDRPTVDRLLASAARNRTHVDVARAPDVTPKSGTLDRLTNDTIELIVHESVESPEPESLGLRRVTVNLRDEPFWFEADVIECRRADGNVRLVIRRPTELSRCQRRRFSRTQIRQSSAVSVTDAAGVSAGRGAVLNISPDGLACRFDRIEADALAVEEVVGLRFALDGDAYVYELAGIVKSKTEASDPNQTILRLQFEPDSIAPDVRERLTRATASPRPNS